MCLPEAGWPPSSPRAGGLQKPSRAGFWGRLGGTRTEPDPSTHSVTGRGPLCPTQGPPLCLPTRSSLHPDPASLHTPLPAFCSILLKKHRCLWQVRAVRSGTHGVVLSSGKPRLTQEVARSGCRAHALHPVPPCLSEAGLGGQVHDGLTSPVGRGVCMFTESVSPEALSPPFLGATPGLAPGTPEQDKTTVSLLGLTL